MFSQQLLAIIFKQARWVAISGGARVHQGSKQNRVSARNHRQRGWGGVWAGGEGGGVLVTLATWSPHGHQGAP